MTTIIASTTLNTGYNVNSDTTGTLVFQTGATPTTAMSISSAQVVTFTNPPVGVSAFPTGTALVFAQTAAPTGWTKSTTHDNKALRVVTGAASSGGSVAFTTAFASQSVSGTIASTTATNQNTTAAGSVSTSVSGSNTGTTATGTVGSTTLSSTQIPSHNHQSVVNAASGNVTWGSGGTISGVNASAYASGTGAYTSSTGGGGSHNHSLTMDSHTHTWSGSASSSFTGTAHTHTQDAHNHTFSGTAINLAVQYVDVIIATKD